jgi:prepilin peptidase CpaA
MPEKSLFEKSKRGGWTMDWLANFLVASVSLIAIITDARWHKIPNWLTFPAIVAGFLVNAVSGWEGLARSIGGFAFALAFMLPFFALDLLKAGDVKLVVAWGTIKGLGQPAWQSFALWAFLYGALLGGLMSILLLACKKALPETWRRVQGLLLSSFRLELDSNSSPMKMPMPYGIALGLGSFLALGLEIWFGQPCPFVVG